MDKVTKKLNRLLTQIKEELKRLKLSPIDAEISDSYVRIFNENDFRDGVYHPYTLLAILKELEESNLSEIWEEIKIAKV